MLKVKVEIWSCGGAKDQIWAESGSNPLSITLIAGTILTELEESDGLSQPSGKSRFKIANLGVSLDIRMNQPKTNDKPLSQREFEAEFHRLLGRLVYAHSQFDYNVGLQLRLLGRWYGTEVAEFLDPKKVPFSKRLKKLRSMILDIYASSGEEALAELSNFFKRADEATALRNDYVHGAWSWHYRESSRRELVLQFRPLHWNMTPVHPDDSVTMGLEEFAEQVKCAEEVLMGYYHLVEKYSRFVKTPSTERKT